MFYIAMRVSGNLPDGSPISQIVRGIADNVALAVATVEMQFNAWLKDIGFGDESVEFRHVPDVVAFFLNEMEGDPRDIVVTDDAATFILFTERR